jgi:hypothetical protein
LVRLLSRLYPNLHLQCTDGRSPDLDYFNELAKAINPAIDLSDGAPTVVLIVGDSAIEFPCLKFYIGSDQWLARFSLTKPQLSGKSPNRFGAGAAACFAAANLFRHVFRDQLPGGLDEDFIYSTFNGCIQSSALQGPAIKNVNLDDTVLIGLGAIGNGAAWALKDLPLSGYLQGVDGQDIDLSNLQRYILATQDDIDHPKANMIKKYLTQPAVTTHPIHYDQYLLRRGNWNVFRAAVCVDSAKDRRIVQGSLPKRIINAWTGQEQCGLSRHYDFINDPCLACLYQPEKEIKSLPERIAESLGFREASHIYMVRDYMANERSVDLPMIHLIATIRGIDLASLMDYAGKQVEVFYSEVVCGGVIMQLTGGTQQEAAEVPSAFESVMAGILLAAELVIDCGQLRSPKPFTINKLNLLRPITRYTHDAVNKGHTPDCICHDPVFRDVYMQKWNTELKRRLATHQESTDQQRETSAAEAHINETAEQEKIS